MRMIIIENDPSLYRRPNIHFCQDHLQYSQQGSAKYTFSLGFQRCKMDILFA